MAFIPIPQTVRAVLRFQQGTDERQSVLHYKKGVGSPTAGDLLVIAQNLIDWWNGPGNAMCNSALALFEVVCTDISLEGGSQLSQPVQPPVPGSQVADPSPGNVTGTLSWRTARTGRRYRGRTYLPGFSEASTNADSTITAGQVLNMITGGANLLFGYVPSGYTLAVASKVAAAAEPVTRVVVENVLDSMRRRLPKRGI